MWRWVLGLLGLGAVGGVTYYLWPSGASSGGGSGPPDETRQKILRVLAQVESGGMKYDTLFIDPGKEFSYGLLQTTLKGGGIGRLLDLYIEKGGQYAEQFGRYMEAVRAGDVSLENDLTFKNLLKQAARDPIMQRTQDEYFASAYLERAYKWAEDKGFKLPVSLLAIADTFVHSGSATPFSWAGITSFPGDGEKEEEVLARYLSWREEWLTNKGGVLARTAFRPATWKQLLTDDPQLAGSVNIRGKEVA